MAGVSKPDNESTVADDIDESDTDKAEKGEDDAIKAVYSDRDRVLVVKTDVKEEIGIESNEVSNELLDLFMS